MEIGLREILILMAMIVMAVIAVDIFKRSRQNRNALKFRLEPIAETLDDPLATEIGSVRKAHRDPAQHARFDDVEEAYADVERPQLAQLNANSVDQVAVQLKHEFTIETPVEEKPHSSSVSAPRVASEATKAAAQQRAANKTASRTRTFAAAQKTENTKTVDPTDVIILNIMARPQHHFAGDAIVKAALLCGLRYGENNIFHFYEPSSVSRKDKSIFSLVNLVKPGTFDMNNMQNFTSPGLCLFMGVPGPDNIEASFQKMLLVAHKLANQLDTDLYDELHNPLTQKRLKQIHERVVQLHQAQMQAQGSDPSSSLSSPAISSPAHSSMA